MVSLYRHDGTDSDLDLLRGRCRYLPFEKEYVCTPSFFVWPDELTNSKYCATKGTVDETSKASSSNGSRLSSPISKRYQTRSQSWPKQFVDTAQYVDPQRNVADVIVPRGVENHVAMCEWSPHLWK